jgi:predicted negative regulator of RcsB-dependent stress response
MSELFATAGLVILAIIAIGTLFGWIDWRG